MGSDFTPSARCFFPPAWSFEIAEMVPESTPQKSDRGVQLQVVEIQLRAMD